MSEADCEIKVSFFYQNSFALQQAVFFYLNQLTAQNIDKKQKSYKL